jgi:hypothetical protein
MKSHLRGKGREMVRLTAFLDRNDPNQLRLASDFLNRLALVVQAHEELQVLAALRRPEGPANDHGEKAGDV